MCKTSTKKSNLKVKENGISRNEKMKNHVGSQIDTKNRYILKFKRKKKRKIVKEK